MSANYRYKINHKTRRDREGHTVYECDDRDQALEAMKVMIRSKPGGRLNKDGLRGSYLNEDGAMVWLRLFTIRR